MSTIRHFLPNGFPNWAIPKRLLLAAFCVLLGSGCGIAEGLMAFYGLHANKTEPAVLRDLLAPHDLWTFPEGADTERHPAFLLLPGCAGTQPFHLQWAKRLSEAGYASLLIDSFAARGITDPAELDGACEGEHTWGFERAGDVLVSLADLRTHPRVDPERLALFGWSHGGWGVMDAVALAGAAQTPPLLARMPNKPLDGVIAAFALYPYCDFGTYTRQLGWPTRVNGHVILASRDQNIEPQPCRDTVTKVASGALGLLEFDADHWFDNPAGFDLVPHEFDAGSTNELFTYVHATLTSLP